MRLVTVAAGGMARVGMARLGDMARSAVRHLLERVVRQTGVTSLAVLMTAACSDALHLRAVARTARRLFQGCEHEVMRLVAFGANRAFVERAIRGNLGVALAARNRFRLGVSCIRMRIVTARASSAATTRMLRVNGLVAVSACGRRRASHVVRRVAAGAILMGPSLRVSHSQHEDPRMARAAWLYALRAEVVRFVARGAFAVATSKNCALGDVRSFFSEVTASAARFGDRCRRVGVGVTRRAYSNGVRFCGLAVLHVEVLVALRARQRHRLVALVNTVALHAIGRAMHADGGRIPERLRMAAHAVVRRGTSELRVERRLRCNAPLSEGVT